MPAPRILFYSHDSYGLGHLRRTANLAAAVQRRFTGAACLCVTGSPSSDLIDLPPRCDIVKLPCATKDPKGNYVPRRLPGSISSLIAMRSEILGSVWRSFAPHVVVVDHSPAGLGGELLPLLHQAGRRGRTRLVLGLRDILDEPKRAREELGSPATLDLLRSCYDAVLVYGDRRVLDLTTEFGLPADVAAKLTYVGYVTPRVRAGEVQLGDAGARPRILATTGGGEDGYPLLRAVVAAMRGPMRGEPIEATIVTGPMLPQEQGEVLALAVQRDPRIKLVRSTDDLLHHLACADVVLSMGGYNSVFEALSRRRRLLVWPRTGPRREQYERAQRLAQLGLLSLLDTAELEDPARLAQRLRDRLREAPPDPEAAGVAFDGAGRAAAEIAHWVQAPQLIAERSAV